MCFEFLLNLVGERRCNVVLQSPPCSTFAVVRGATNENGSPRPLRDLSGPGIYGRAELTDQEKQAVRAGTFFAVRAAHIFRFGFIAG